MGNANNFLENRDILNLFTSDKDINGTDLLEMSNFFELFIESAEKKLNDYNQWERVIDFNAIIGRLSTIMKFGFDINDMGVMVADCSHFSKEIINKLKKGIYQIGESKEVAGNYRPVIVDKDGHIVKHFTMKKAINPKEVLSNVSSLSIHNSLRQISTSLSDISKDLKYEIEFTRRQNLSLPFINARTRFINAINNPKDKLKHLEQAESYLIEGLNALYLDIDAEVKKLSEPDLSSSKNIIRDLFVGSLKHADTILGRINEDMLMIPKYVAVEIYILQYLERFSDAKSVIGQYKYHLDNMTNKLLPNCAYTAVEVIHNLYPYQKDNLDFWLEMPKQTINALDALQLLLELKDTEVFLIETTDNSIEKELDYPERKK